MAKRDPRARPGAPGAQSVQVQEKRKCKQRESKGACAIRGALKHVILGLIIAADGTHARVVYPCALFLSKHKTIFALSFGDVVCFLI